VRPSANGGPGATLLVNAPDEAWLSAEARDTLDRSGIARLNVGADRIALAERAPLSANLVVLGYGSARGAVPFGPEELLATILRISPPRFQEQNQKLFNLGVDAA